MKKYAISILLSLSYCAAWPQSDMGVSATVSESTDPARAAQVKRKAQEINNQDDQSSDSSGKNEHVSTDDENKKLRGPHKSKSPSGASGGAGQSRSGEGGGSRPPIHKSPSDSPNTTSGLVRYSTPATTGNPNYGAHEYEKRLREKEANSPPGMIVNLKKSD